MKKVIVFGAAGVLGLPTCKYLKESGYDVLALGHHGGNKVYDFFTNLGIEYGTVDISDKTSFKELPGRDVYCVVNLAGVLPASMKEDPDNTLYPDTIIKGTINILDYMRRVGCCKLIFPQSVYDLNYKFGSSWPLSPDLPRMNPTNGDHSVYVICKNAAVDVIKYYHNEHGINSIILRLPGVYQYHPKPYILINGVRRLKSERIIIEKAKRGETIEIWGDPNRILESVCLDDFLQIVRLSVESNIEYEILNVGNGGSTLEERILGIRDVFCRPDKMSEIVYCPEKKDCTQYVLDIEKTKRLLGYAPKFTWHDYLVNLKKNMETNPNKEVWGTFEQYYDLL